MHGATEDEKTKKNTMTLEKMSHNTDCERPQPAPAEARFPMIEQACNDVLMTSSCSRTRPDMALLFLAFCRGGSLFFVSFLFPQEMATKVRSSLPFSTKVEIIRRVERGEKSEVAASFKIARSTLSTILKNKPAILQKARDRPNADGKRIRAPAFDRVEKALYAWFLDIRARNLPVSGPMLQQKAKDFAFLLDVQAFSGGSGWLQRFKERYDIVGKVVAGESRAVDNESVKKWIAENWPAITEQYRPCDIYNTDETALFWQLLPSRTLARQGEKWHGGKLNKARITVLLTTNMDGSCKLTPLIIGKSKAPMCLRGCRSLPVKYTSNGKAWMTRVLFEDWLRDWDEKLSETTAIYEGRRHADNWLPPSLIDGGNLFSEEEERERNKRRCAQQREWFRNRREAATA
ncbi:tigger transposable element-derived protein 6-like [Ixodes scapularis]